MNIDGKVVFVTGGLGEIAQVFIPRFLEKGCKVIMTDIVDGKGKSVENKLKILYGNDKIVYLTCDATDKQQFENAYQQAVDLFGHIDVHINNAGYCDEFRTEDSISLTFGGVCLGTDIAVNNMKKDNGGRGGVIINIASIAGLYPMWEIPSYCGTKAAIINYTRACAMNPTLKENGIRCNVVCPSAVEGTLHARVKHRVLDHASYMNVVDSVGLVSPQDVTDAMMKLIEEDHNGCVLLVAKKEGQIFMQLPDLPV